VATVSGALREARLVGGPVDLGVFDLRGKRLRTLAAGEFGPGSHTVTFRGDDPASGVYFHILDAEGRREQRKMIPVK